MAETELSVVCKSCGSEVSPYVTECPYCGTRLRKRAPKLERRGEGLEPKETRRDRRRRRTAERRERRERLRGLSLAAERPYVTIAAILIPAALVIVDRSTSVTLFDLGVVVGTPATTNPWWHYLAAPFVYNDIGYLFAIGVAMVLFVPGLERRLGAIPTALLLVACGALGALAAPGLDDAFGDGFTLAAGGNGIALGALGAWFMVRRSEARDDPTEAIDVIVVVVSAIVLLLLPLVNDYANEWSGIVGGLVGLAAGFSATLGGRR